jgi:hypothetical protein
MRTTLQLIDTEDDVATKVGKNIIELLNLKVKKNGRVDTAWGDKTPAGLARTVKRALKA